MIYKWSISHFLFSECGSAARHEAEESDKRVDKYQPVVHEVTRFYENAWNLIEADGGHILRVAWPVEYDTVWVILISDTDLALLAPSEY